MLEVRLEDLISSVGSFCHKIFILQKQGPCGNVRMICNKFTTLV